MINAVVRTIGRASALPIVVCIGLFSADPVDGWIAEAERAGLAQDPEWLVLLHAVPAAGGFRSRVDDPSFFLAPDGARNPSEELVATLRGLALPTPGTSAAMARFPGRAEFLVRRLGIDREALPMPRSAAFEDVWDRLGATRAVLVFPDAYMGTPASMFGHTLLVIHGRAGVAALQQAVNYAAATTETNGPLFAVRGIFGGYPGRFSLSPYHERLQEYTNTEHRDLWEYELDLDQEAIRRLLLHLWDHKDHWSGYYFFDENCSYQLLFLLDAARPGLALHRRVRPWVIPTDTVRLVADAGLVRSVSWRPSLAEQVRTGAAGMDTEEITLVKAIAAGGTSAALAGLPAPRQALILDTAAAWLQARRFRGAIAQDDYARRQLSVLRARARVGRVPPPPEPPMPVPPDRGHRSLRLTVGGGSDGGQGFAEVALRPAYHDWMDPQAGYAAGSEVVFGEVAVRVWEDDGLPELDRVDVLRVRSYRPVDDFFLPPTWTGGLSYRRDPIGDADERESQAVGDLGVGLAFGGPSASIYAMAVAEGRLYGPDRGHAIGVGGDAGIILDAGDALRARSYARVVERVLGDRGTDVWTGIDVRWNPARDTAFGVQAEWRDLLDVDRMVVSARVAVYF